MFNAVQQELYQALLNTCSISGESIAIRESAILNATNDDISPEDLTPVNRELYQALLNTCKVSGEASKILCNMLSSTGGGGGLLNDKYNIIFNDSMTLNLTPAQVEEILEDKEHITMIIDTVENKEQFYGKHVRSIVISDYTVEHIESDPPEYWLIQDTEQEIVYYSEGFNTKFTRVLWYDGGIYIIDNSGQFALTWAELNDAFLIDSDISVTNQTTRELEKITRVYKEANSYVVETSIESNTLPNYYVASTPWEKPEYVQPIVH